MFPSFSSTLLTLNYSFLASAASCILSPRTPSRNPDEEKYDDNNPEEEKYDDNNDELSKHDHNPDRKKCDDNDDDLSEHRLRKKHTLHDSLVCTQFGHIILGYIMPIMNAFTSHS